MIKPLIVIGLSTFATAHAVEFLPCQRALSGNIFTAPDGHRHALDPGQIVVRGKLQEFWETGMEDQTSWSIFDDETSAHLSANAFDALHGLNAGAPVYIMDAGGAAVVARGFHEEETERDVAKILGRTIELAPNRPRLRVAPGDTRTAISNAAYRRHFESESPAVAIVRPHANTLKRLDETLAPLIAGYEKHRLDPSRFVDVGSGRRHERQLYETVLWAIPEVRSDGRVRVRTSDGPQKLVPHDLLYLIAADGAALGDVRIDNFPARLQTDDVARMSRAARVVLVQKGFQNSWADETDF